MKTAVLRYGMQFGPPSAAASGPAALSGWCGVSGTAAVLTRIVVMAPATAAGTDMARVGTTCSALPGGG